MDTEKKVTTAMPKSQFMVIVIALALAVIGLLSALMLSICHGLLGNWVYLGIFIVICIIGGIALYPVIKQLKYMVDPWTDDEEDS